MALRWVDGSEPTTVAAMAERPELRSVAWWDPRMVDELGAAMGLNWAFEQADLTAAQTERDTADWSAG